MTFDLQTGYLRGIKIKKIYLFIYLFRLNLTQFIPENQKKNTYSISDSHSSQIVLKLMRSKLNPPANGTQNNSK